MLATGANIIDRKTVDARGVILTNAPDYSTASVAQLTFALVLELASRVGAHFAGAAVEVLSSEPPPPTHPLLGVRNCLITPHLGWATVAARRRLMAVAVANVRAFLDGRPQNVVGAG